MRKSMLIGCLLSLFLILSIPLIPSVQSIEVEEELEEIANNNILEIEQFLEKIINIITQKPYTDIYFFNILTFLILIVYHIPIFFSVFFVYILDDLIFDMRLDYGILYHLIDAFVHTIYHFMDMMYLVTMPGGLILFLWALLSQIYHIYFEHLFPNWSNFNSRFHYFERASHYDISEY